MPYTTNGSCGPTLIAAVRKPKTAVDRVEVGAVVALMGTEGVDLGASVRFIARHAWM